MDYAMKHQNFTMGRSGSFFVYSPGKKVIIKTIPEHEYRKMCQILPFYYWVLSALFVALPSQHIMDNPGSILVKILGCFEVKVYQSSIFVIVMENVFANFDVQKIYDLKVAIR